MRLILSVIVAFVGLTSLALESWERCYHEENGVRCRNKKMNGSVYCATHEGEFNRTLSNIKKTKDGCKRIINGKHCGSRCVEGSMYCYNCKQIVDRERKESIEKEVKAEIAYENLKSEVEAERKRQERENMVSLIAEGVGAAMGKTKCKWDGCGEFLEKGEVYCSTHKEMAKERLKRMAREAEQEAAAKASIKRCEARYIDGAQCQNKTNPFSDYCAVHQDFDPAHPLFRAEVDKPPETPEEYITLTRRRIDKLVELIIAKRNKNGTTPSSLQALRALCPAHSAPAIRDAWGTGFYYETDGVRFAIMSLGPDRKSDTADDIVVYRD